MAKLTVVDQFPAEDASDVYINDIIWAQFSEEINPESATYYNFTVNERDTYEPVDGEVLVQGISGNLDNAVAVFVPSNNLKRNTAYSVLVSTAISNTNATSFLDHDTIWYFNTGNELKEVPPIGSSGTIVPSGITDPTPSGDLPGDAVPGELIPLDIVTTTPADYGSNVNRSLPNIAITFSSHIPETIDLYDKITLSARKVLS